MREYMPIHDEATQRVLKKPCVRRLIEQEKKEIRMERELAMVLERFGSPELVLKWLGGQDGE